MSQKSKKNIPAPGRAVRSESRMGSGPGASAVAFSPAMEEAEPQVDASPMPAWIFVLLIVLAYWGMLHLDRYGGGFNEFVYGPYHSFTQLADLQPKSGSEMILAQGAASFAMYCKVCHGEEGTGTPGTVPPLAGSEWVQGPPARLIRIPNNGLTGPITVKNQPWALTMTPFGAGLSDSELASILSYIRNSWGNKAPIVTPEQVKAVRDEIGARPRDGSAPWTSAELLKIPE
jgi:mono/diheme cytochrome c family protein